MMMDQQDHAVVVIPIAPKRMIYAKKKAENVLIALNLVQLLEDLFLKVHYAKLIHQLENQHADAVFLHQNHARRKMICAKKKVVDVFQIVDHVQSAEDLYLMSNFVELMKQQEK